MTRGKCHHVTFAIEVEAALAAVPRVREKGELIVEEAVLLERLVVAAFPDIQLPVDEATLEEGQVAFEV